MAIRSPARPRISARDATAPAVETIANVCAALADPTRLRILALLVHGEVCVCDIHGSLNVPQPTASRHLAYLRRHGLVATRRDGLWVHYRLADDLPGGVRHAIDGVLHCVTHSPEARMDGRNLARTTGRRVPLRPVPTRGCCGPGAVEGEPWPPS
jgi:ArsR family transcriptional regulator, arsenate/arsenite/antimonite-responsive transcriptional repressor